MGDLAEFMTDEVTVRTLTGVGGMGETYAAPYTFNCSVDEKRSLVRAADGSQIVSECTIYDEELGRTNVWEPGSDVLLPSGRWAKVIGVNRRVPGTFDLPAHLEVTLT